MRVRIHAAARLAAEGRRDVLAEILAGFRSKDGPTRALATAALPHFGRDAAHLLPELLERLARQEALWLPPVGGSHEQGEEEAIDAAVRALGPYDLPRLFELLGHEDFDLSYAARSAFVAAGRDGIAFFETVWGAAAAAQRTQMLDVARGAFHGQADPALQEDVRHLATRGLADPDPRVRLQAAKTLDRDPSSVDRRLDVLAVLLDDESIHTVRMAAYLISAQGARAARVEAALKEHAAHPDDETRGYVRTAVEAIEDAR